MPSRHRLQFRFSVQAEAAFADEAVVRGRISDREDHAAILDDVAHRLLVYADDEGYILNDDRAITWSMM